MGDPNPENNASLRLAIEKAKSNSMPKVNIENAVAKAKGGKDSDNFEEAIYEAYADGGVALMIYCLTDNNNRTLTNLKIILNKNGGRLAESGSVQYMFSRLAMLVIKNNDLNIDALMETALENNATDFQDFDDIIIIYAESQDFELLKTKIDGTFPDLEYIKSEISMIPNNEVAVTAEEQLKIENLIELLEDDDDVQDVYSSLKY